MSELPDNPPGTIDMIWQIIGERGRLTRHEAKCAAKTWNEHLQLQPKAHVILSVSGYDDDPRDLWEFDEVRKFVQQFARFAGIADAMDHAPAVQDMMAGQIDMMIEPSSNFTAQVQAGTIRAIAVPAKTRLFSLPDVPTTDEAGLPGYYASIWFGLWAPKNTPKDIIAKLSSAALAALADDNVKAKLNKLGQQVATRELQDPGAFAAFQKSEAEKWWPIIKAANLKVE